MMVARRALGAGVRKPPREETAGGVARWRVRRYGDFVAVGLLPGWVDRLFGKRSMGWRAWSADCGGPNRRRAVAIEQHDGYPGPREGEFAHCWSRAGETEALQGNVAAKLI